MKTLAIFFLFALFSGVQAQDLSSYRDRKRVVLLFVGDKLPEQQVLFAKSAEELKERDMVSVEVPAKEEKLHRKYEVKAGEFTLILLGKDGGEKYRSGKIVKPETLFSLIDTMPMRKEEMARKRRSAD